MGAVSISNGAVNLFPNEIHKPEEKIKLWSHNLLKTVSSCIKFSHTDRFNTWFPLQRMCTVHSLIEERSYV